MWNDRQSVIDSQARLMEQTIKQARLLKIPAKTVQAVSPNCFQASSLLQVTTHAKLLNNNSVFTSHFQLATVVVIVGYDLRVCSFFL